MIIHLLSKELNGFKSINKSFYKFNIESHDYMQVSMVILAFLSILIGYLFSDIFIGLGTPIWSNSIYISPNHENWANYSFLPYYIKDLPLFFAIISISFIWFFFNRNQMHIYNWLNEYINYIKSLSNPILFKRLKDIGFNAFFFNNLYNYIFIYLYKLFYLLNVKYLDKGLFEYFGPTGLYNINKFILRKPYFFFHTIYYSLFLKFFFILNTLIFIHFFLSDSFCLTNLGIISLALVTNLFFSDKIDNDIKLI